MNTRAIGIGAFPAFDDRYGEVLRACGPSSFAGYRLRPREGLDLHSSVEEDFRCASEDARLEEASSGLGKASRGVPSHKKRTGRGPVDSCLTERSQKVCSNRGRGAGSGNVIAPLCEGGRVPPLRAQ